MRLKTKIVLLAGFSSVVSVLLMLGMVRKEAAPVIREVHDELFGLAKANVQQIAVDARALCEIAHDTLAARLDQGVAAASKVLADGQPLVGTNASSERTWRGQAFSAGNTADGRSAFAAEVHALTGLDAEVYWLTTANGHSAWVAGSGAPLPGADAEGREPAFMARIRAGETHRDVQSAKGIIRLSDYVPVRSADQTVAGVLRVSLPPEPMTALRAILMGITVGKTGYVWIIDGQGDERGTYVLSKDGAKDGTSLWNETSGSGHYFVRSIISKAAKLKGAAVDFELYDWRNEGETEAREKISAFTYFGPWDWIIGAGTYSDDYFDARRRVERLMARLLKVLGVSGLCVFLLAAGVAMVMGRSMTRPIERMAGVAEVMAGGKLALARKELEALQKTRTGKNRRFRDETHGLAQSFDRMVQALCELVGNVQRSGIQVTSSSTTISAGARQLEAAVAEQAASLTEVSATTRQISATGQELAVTMEGVAGMANDTSRLAAECQLGLRQMEDKMRLLMESTEGISGKLDTISQRTGGISGIVTTITKIADQTNLLSLNAAIEAEKAGEYGIGFSVVAREVRRLADQTAVATLGIDRMVRESNAAVSAGVMEMDQFVDRVRQSIGEAGRLNQTMETIITHVQELGPRFNQALEGMQSQSAGAGQISQALQQLNDAAAGSRGALGEFNEATRHLADAVQRLRRGVANFETE